MAGGRIQTWWRARSIDQISYPASPASVDVSAAKAQWDKLASGLTCVPRILKKAEKIDLGNGKKGMKTSRGILQSPAKENSRMMRMMRMMRRMRRIRRIRRIRWMRGRETNPIDIRTNKQN